MSSPVIDATTTAVADRIPGAHVPGAHVPGAPVPGAPVPGAPVSDNHVTGDHVQRAHVPVAHAPGDVHVPDVIGHYLRSSVTFDIEFMNNLLASEGNKALKLALESLVRDVGFSYNVRFEYPQLTRLEVWYVFLSPHFQSLAVLTQLYQRNNAHSSPSDPENHATVRAYAGNEYVGTFHIPQVGGSWVSDSFKYNIRLCLSLYP